MSSILPPVLEVTAPITLPVLTPAQLKRALLGLSTLDVLSALPLKTQVPTRTHVRQTPRHRQAPIQPQDYFISLVVLWKSHPYKRSRGRSAGWRWEVRLHGAWQQHVGCRRGQVLVNSCCPFGLYRSCCISSAHFRILFPSV